MDNSEFKKIVRKSTGKYGFIYCKKNYYYNSDNLIVVINLQKSNFDNGYYINYGFCVKEIHNDLQYPKSNECDITGRFLNGTNKDIYPLDTMNVDELALNLDNNMMNFIVPVIDEGIGKYFELFPKAVCRATLKLKKYLGMN